MSRFSPAPLAAATAGLFLAALTGAAALADPVRIHHDLGSWYSVSGGEFTYAQFYPDNPDGSRSFGTEQSVDGAYARVKSAAPAALQRVGVRLDSAGRCFEQRTKDALGRDGWAYACVFPQATGPAPAAAATVAQAAPPRPPAPVAVAAVAAPKRAAPAPSRPAETPAPSAPPALTQLAGKPSAQPAGDDETAALNRKIKAAADAVDQRNSAAQAKFEAQKAAFEAEKKAGQDAYAAQLAAHKAEVEALERKHQAEIEAWQAKVKACKAGDVSQCGN